jgi:hypothetical protein
MTLDNGWALIISTVVGVFLMWIGALIGKHFSNGEHETEEAHAKIEALELRLTAQELAFAKYQTHVAENYPKNRVLEQMEAKLIAAMLRMEQKLDKLRGG